MPHDITPHDIAPRDATLRQHLDRAVEVATDGRARERVLDVEAEARRLSAVSNIPSERIARFLTRAALRARVTLELSGSRRPGPPPHQGRA